MSKFNCKQMIKELTFYFISYSLIFCPNISFAQTSPQNNIIIDQNAHFGGKIPNFEKSQNGTDVLNIVAPTQGGVSHNKFVEYNVNEQGLIINNLSFQNGVGQAESQIGGTVAYNKNLGTGDSARVILHEVTSNSISSLKGYTEVFGQKAALIIANPNGITCEGCGFINTSKLTMITGSSNMENGNIKDFNISNVGVIKINGVGEQNFGLHVDKSSAKIVSNMVKVAGLVLLDDDKDLEILTGNDKFNYNTGEITSDNTYQVEVAVDSTALGGMRAGNIRIHATQKGFGVNTDGDLIADMDKIEITANGEIAFKNIAANKKIHIGSNNGKATAKNDGAVFAGEEIILASTNNNIELNSDYIYSNNISLQSGNDIINNSQIFADASIMIEANRDFDNFGDVASLEIIQISSGRDIINQATGNIIAGDALGLYSNNNIINYGNISSSYLSELVANNDIINDGKITSSVLVNLYSSNDIINKNEISSNSIVFLETVNKLENQSKITAGEFLDIKSKDIHNYGQLLSNEDIEVETDNDFINYQNAAALAGKTINFIIGANLVNYLAEIFAIGDISFTGNGTAHSNVDTSIEYDNPYVTDERTYDGSGNGDQAVDDSETETFEPLEIYLTDLDITLTLPLDAFGDNPQSGDSYIFSDGFKVTLGANIDDLIITDDQDNPINFSLFDDGEEAGETIQEGGGNTAKEENDNLGPFANSTPFAPEINAMNSLQNIGGHIESFGNIAINSHKLYNIGFDYNKGLDGYTVEYDKIRDSACWNCGNQELGRYKIKDTMFSSISGKIISGNDLNISAREILNQSSTMSAKNNILIKTDSLTNVTSSYLADLAIQYQTRKKSKNSTGRTSRKTWNSTGHYKDRVYSNAFSLITAGANLVIDATGGSVINDQVEDATGFFFGRDNAPNLSNGIINVDINLPTGSNGLFVVGHNPKYLVTSNVSFLDAQNFVGSDYFFDRITPISGKNNTRKIIGDAAYETRLVMDALRQATTGHYLNDTIGSDMEQMKALYANASNEHRTLDLKVGIALTADQIAALTNDIIWYVEKEINSEKILVPKLYLSQATRSQIDQGFGSGAKMTGGNVAIQADNLSNSGDIFAKNNLTLKAGYLNNESNWLNQARIIGGSSTNIEADLLKNSSGLIGGGTTIIKADNVINETKVYTEEVRLGKNYNLTQKTGHDAVISGDDGLKIEVDNAFINRGASVVSSNGDIYIKADTATFDTVELHNRTESHKKSSGFLSKKSETKIEDSVINVASNVMASNNIIPETAGNTTIRGSNIVAGENALLNVGGDLNILSAHDSDYSYLNKKKSSMGGLKSSKDMKETSTTTAIGSNIVTGNDLTIVSARNINVVGSNINVGNDAKVYTGYTVDSQGNLQKSGENGSFNLINDIDTSFEKTRHEEKDLTKAFNPVEQLKNALKQGWDQITDSIVPTDFDDPLPNRGKFVVEMELGTAEKTSKDIDKTNVVSSNFYAGNDLSINANNDINVQGSNIYANNDINLNAEGDINFSSAANVTKIKEVTEKSKISGKATVGNAYVDVGYAAKDLLEATKDVAESLKDLNDIKKLHSDGKASKDALEDAYLNFEMANLNMANANLALVAAAAGAATAASSSFGTGMYASAGVQYETNKTEFNEETIRKTQSNIASELGNINIASGKNINQEGTNIYATEGKISYDAGNNLTIEASKDSYKISTKSSNLNAGASVGNNAVQISFDIGGSTGRANSSTYSNSEIIAKDIDVKTGNNAFISGVNMAGDNIKMDIGNDLHVESVQDTSYSKNNNWSMGLSGGGGAGSASGGGGFSVGKGNSNSAWVNNVTGIIGSESVEIEVGGNTSLKGAVIASGEYDASGKFTDKGNLKLTTNELEYSDINDYSSSRESQFGVSTNIGKSTDKGASSKAPSGSTTITLKDTGHELEGVTKATIGQGEIVVGGNVDTNLEGLNRDVNNVQEITKDIITGALDGSVTIDNRILTSTGRTEILTQFKEFDENIIKTGENIKLGANSALEIGSNVVNTIKDGADGKLEGKGIVTAFLDKHQSLGIEYDLAVKHPDLRDALNSPESLSPEQMDRLKEVLVANGVSVNEVMLYSESDLRQGFATMGADGGYDKIALGIIDQNTGQTLSGEELAKLLHYEKTKHEVGELTTDQYADYIGIYGESARDLYNGLTGGEYGTTSISRDDYNQIFGGSGSKLEQNNQFVNQTPIADTQNKAMGGIIGGIVNTALYDKAAREAGNGDPVKGHQILQENPYAVPWYGITINTIEEAGNSLISWTDSAVGLTAKGYANVVGDGNSTSAMNEFLQTPLSYLTEGFSEESSKYITAQINTLKELHPDKKDEIDYYSAQYFKAIAGYVAGESLTAGKGKVGTGRVIENVDGYYTVEGGLKISEAYYNKLWREGRPAPLIQAEEILKSNPKITTDPKGVVGFNKYESGGLEMIYNPKTKEILHIQPIKMKGI